MKCECFKPKHIVFEDDKCIAMLSDEPLALGHIIVAPKEHIPIIEIMPDDLLAHCFIVANEVSKKLFEKLNIHGTNILINNGFPAQEKSHFSINILPRSENDNIAIEWQPQEAKPEEIKDSGLFVRDALEKLEQKKQAPAEHKEEPKKEERVERFRRLP